MKKLVLFEKLIVSLKRNMTQLLLLCGLMSSLSLSAQSDFITEWNFATADSEISFGALTSGGAVNYTWSARPSGNSGTGSFTQATAGLTTITGLTIDAGDTVTLSMTPTNLKRFYIESGSDAPLLTNVSQWGTAAWTSMAYAFNGCANLHISATDVPDLSLVSSMTYMFGGCTSLNGPANINTWNTGSVTNMTFVFYNAVAFNQNIGNWNTSNVLYIWGMFYNAAAFNQDLNNWNTASVQYMDRMFYDAIAFNGNIGNWNTAAVIDMNEMFAGAAAFNQDISGWNTSVVTNMYNMFNGASVFNQDINNWNVSSVTNMSQMFIYASAFNQDLNSWNTSAVTNMEYMFFLCTSFNGNIGNWNTSSVTNMGNMFRYCAAFNKDISNWNTAAVTNMTLMFANCPSFNQDLSSWNTADVTSLSDMFGGCASFNQDLGSWTLNANVIMDGMLNMCGMNCNNYSNTLIGWQTNNPTVINRTLGAGGLSYNSTAAAARDSLTTTQGWTITDAGTAACTQVSTSSISENDNNFSIYPNPATSLVMVSNVKVGSTLAVVDVLGKVIYTRAINNSQTELNVSDLTSGIYFIQITDNGALLGTKKLVVE